MNTYYFHYGTHAEFDAPWLPSADHALLGWVMPTKVVYRGKVEAVDTLCVCVCGGGGGGGGCIWCVLGLTLTVTGAEHEGVSLLIRAEVDDQGGASMLRRDTL